VTLKSGANDAIEDGPNAVTFVAKAAGVTAAVVSETLAHCVVTQQGTSATETKFAVKLEYEVDDGFNGCDLRFTNASGYRADIRVGLNVGD
jgi:hypothetical protein